MELPFIERVMLVILAALLLTGALILHVRHSRPLCKVVVTTDGAEKAITLTEADAMLREKRRIDVNSASAAELASIPGIGKGLALKILEQRSDGAVFAAEEDLLRVPGIGPKKLEKIKEYVKFK